MSKENLQLVREMFGAWQDWRSGRAGLRLDYLDPNVEWETRWPGLPRFFHGRQGVEEWTARFLEPMEMELELIDVRPIDEERVFLIIRARGEGRASGAPAEMNVFDIWSIRDEMIYRRQTFHDRAEALEAAGLSE